MATAKKTAAGKTTAKTAEAIADAGKTAQAAANDAFASIETISNAARDQFESFVAAVSENSKSLREQADEMIETYRDSLETAKEHMRTVNAELMNAAREETQEAVEFVNNLARAKSPVDALELQRDYWTKLFETRVQRARELTEASFEAARGSFEPFSTSLNAFPATGFEKFFPFSAK